jgi:anaerobic dimethyl sulfoxide reductase subunit B (iron-sulfur subunit)
MEKKGLLVDSKWCTGCHSCEIACQMEHGLPPEQFGIKVLELGPWHYGGDRWQYAYLPALTQQCDLCGARLARDKKPACVKHCQSQCLSFVSPGEALVKLEDKARQLYITR